jgi:hypothetical protein
VGRQRTFAVSQRDINFVRQQGFRNLAASSCRLHYPGLQFQPRVLGLIVLAGILQSPKLFVALAAVLSWCALVPSLNPFELVHNRFLAPRRGLPTLPPAPPPRRFAQALAAIMAFTIGWAIISGRMKLAWAIEASLLAAIVAILFGGFCFGSFVFHTLTGNLAFARRTLPWARDVGVEQRRH